MTHQPISIFWFRRDLRLEDNAGFYHALKSGYPVLPLFIFDHNILSPLKNKNDRRVEFIHLTLQEMQQALVAEKSSFIVKYGDPLAVWQQLLSEFPIAAVYANRDYEPYAIQRDQQVAEELAKHNIPFHTCKDQVIFEGSEVVKEDGTPYVVFTSYKNKWLKQFKVENLQPFPSQAHLHALFRIEPQPMLSLQEIGFQATGQAFPPKTVNEEIIKNYHLHRDYPGIEGTTRLGIHLRFGTVSIRHWVGKAMDLNAVWLNELIWRDFFQSILYHFPHTENHPFRKAYALVPWREDVADFQRWCEGSTGYPIVDAGMRQLNQTGFMHNRVRMICASFLSKHLLLPWQWGERYFAEKLLDYDMAANVGNWQWAAGCGCDAVPYFRVFNPELQQRKYDPQHIYIKKWLPEWGTAAYPKPMIAHTTARIRALKVYSSALKK